MDLGSIAIETRARLHRNRLDTLLAAGARPEDSAELARRAERLASRKMRRGLAASLRNALDAAHEPPATFSSRAPLRREEIRACTSLIEEVASHLEGSAPVSVSGVALVERLLTWGGSPLYAPHGDGALEADLRHARAALLLRSR